MNRFDGFYRNRRVLVTGHTGFKGSWLALWLQTLSAEVTGYALAPPTNPSLFELASVNDCIRSVIGDLCDRDKLNATFSQASPEIVFHLAAQPLVRQSYVDAVETYRVNVMGTLHLLEAVRKTPSVRAVVLVTSDKCYENREWPWPYREDDAMGGSDPYSSSKGCVELLASSFRRSFFEPEGHRVAIATARAGNVIGGGDFAPHRLIPDLVRGAIARRPVVIRSPSAVRPWQHVLDPLAGYLMLAERLIKDGAQFVGGWNFGPAPDDVRTVAEVADSFVIGWGTGAEWQQDKTEHPHEAHILTLDSSKARQRLGWKPRLLADASIAETIAWYRLWTRCTDTNDLRDSMLSSINQYTRSRSNCETHSR